LSIINSIAEVGAVRWTLSGCIREMNRVCIPEN
jgi:hypothetical protein